MTLFPFRFSLLPRCLLVALPTLPAAAYTVGDGFFDPADWSHEVRYDAGFSEVLETVAQSLSGGNPGAYRSVGYSMTWSGVAVYGSVYVISRHLDFNYEPTTLGAITAVTYEEDQTRLSAAWPDAKVAGTPVLFQAGKVFLGPGFVFGPADSSWSQRVFTDLVATHFAELDGMTIVAGSHPDFSATGASISFGYARSNSYSFSSSISHGIDNWFFTVTSAPSIPEPAASAGLAAAVGLAWAGCRRSRPRAG